MMALVLSVVDNSRVPTQSGELAVLFLLYSNLAGVDSYMFHHTHNTLNSAIIVIFAKKRRGSDFIFVSLLTALEFCLYSLAIMKILIFSEIYKLQSLFLFQSYVK